MTPQVRGPRRLPAAVELPEGMADPLVSLAACDGALPLESLFGRCAPLEVEVGTGKGHTLVALAAANPDRDFLGVEVGSKWVRLTRTRLIRAGLTNARLIHGEAQWLLQRYLPRASVRCFHIYFPDPWPKKRHAKRRLFRPDLPPMLARCLEPAGHVRVATDHAAYFEEILHVMQAGGFLEDRDAPWPEDPVSSFEAKYRVQGRPIHRAVHRRAG